MIRKTLYTLVAMVVASTAIAQSTFTSALKAKPAKGATVYGVVECDGKPLQGIAVSDGFEVVVTDKRGCYSLCSAKRNGNVFITIPSGYEVPSTGVIPNNWAKLSEPSEAVERHDFLLKAADNAKHVIMAVTDIHLANQFSDVEQFNDRFMPRLNEEVEKYRSQGLPVYTICLGDSSFDLYWYDYLYEISTFRTMLGDVKYPTQFFNSMGNHDNDPATDPALGDVDFRATAKYRDSFGPSYYSFNIGGIHYVILDNIVYHNDRLATMKKGRNVAGARNYDHALTEEQLAWLKKDLALVEDKSTPIVVAMHCPVYRYENRQAGPITTYFRPDADNAKALSLVLEPFSEVHFLTGHTHKNLTCHCAEDTTKPWAANTIDHNIAAVSGAWWMTAACGGVMLGPDSGPAGFEVFTVEDRRLQWYFTSIDDGSAKQFRTFDMNSVREAYRSSQYSGELQSFLSHFPERTDYAKIGDNEVYIHVWAWENDWKITVKENGKEIATERIAAENPQYTLCYYVPRTLWRQNFVERNATDLCPHMFRVKTSAPDTSLEIEVTDSFGRVYRDTMIRPKPFSKTML